MAKRKSKNKAEEAEEEPEEDEQADEGNEEEYEDEKILDYDPQPKKRSKGKAFLIIGLLVLILIIANLSAWYIIAKPDSGKFNLNRYLTTEKRDTLYQVSTYDALSKGEYGGAISLSSLQRDGDFGIGTFDALDGELVMLEGIIYQVKSSGKVILPSNLEKTPYALVTFFDSDKPVKINSSMTYSQLDSFITSNLPSKNLPYAIKVTGDFNSITTRSIAKQSKPYPTLTEALKNQSIFQMNETRGTIIGFYMPSSLGSLGSAGNHLHFINSNDNFGGHILELNITSGTLYLDQTPKLSFYFPKEFAYFGNLTR